MISEITLKTSSEPIKEYISKYIINLDSINIYSENKNNYIKIFVNGNYLGLTLKPDNIVNDIKHYRSIGVIHIHTSIYWCIEENFIQIWCDEGRLIRPLMKVNEKN